MKKIKYIKKALLVIALLAGFSAAAQQDQMFTQYMFNKLVLNPAYAGSREIFTVDLLNRYQWVGIDGAPRIITLSGHTLLKNSNVGLGAYLYRDEIGPTINQGAMGTYSYRIQTQQGWFSFGIQFGVKYFTFDWNAIDTEYPDAVFSPEDVQRLSPDMNLGVYYQTKRFYAGLSSKQLLENEYGSGKVDGKNTFTKLSRHYYAMLGMAIPIDEKIVFRPSALTKVVGNVRPQVDLNASFLFGDTFWVGLSFRTQRTVAFLTEFRITEYLRLGYSFDLMMNDLQLHNKGTHEFRLGFDIATAKRMKTPRYF
ncbi:type IX secretion system membrane protein PorP/SprF [Draconibacterium sp. IB214405]|uniref:PorP/SprF family type IX secretion system membrane protein n=1 Tax=Draconibacterium sp. IB214405 TaxID=3097352 RepID=UPI002A0E8E3B|nr:type IX secretion system membrane protein PorP/SprF [Draconibacterium sp. IB214405]MDX8340413.1 type IX secretion system membrane protein PorP/SprF [Draconibacterium sp. IB214405]